MILCLIIGSIVFLIYHFYNKGEEADNGTQDVIQEEQASESSTLRIRYI